VDVDWSLIKARNPGWNGPGLSMARAYTLLSTLPRFADALCLVARQSVDVQQLILIWVRDLGPSGSVSGSSSFFLGMGWSASVWWVSSN